MGISELYDSHKINNTQPSLAELSEHLSSVISLFTKVYIVIDALDECEDIQRTRTSLLAEMQNLSTHVQLFFTSRPLEDILLNAVQFEIVAQEDDMRKYLSAQIQREQRLSKLCADNEGLEDEILSKIIKKVDGMFVSDPHPYSYFLTSERAYSNTLYRFLLAKLHLQSITSKLRVGTVRKALKMLPEKLNGTYDEALKRIQKGQEKDRSELAMKMLMLLSFSLRPLRLGEIQHTLLAMEIEGDEVNIDRNDVYDKELLLTICAGIIILEEGTSAIRFVHHTAETYFEGMRMSLFTNAQMELTTAFVKYLSFQEFQSGPCQTNAEFEERLRLNQLYDYAARNWGHHARHALALGQEVINFLTCKRKVEAASQASMLFKTSYRSDYSQQYPGGTTGLHLAAYFGLSKVVDTFIKCEEDLDPMDACDRTPLWFATQNGYKEVVKLLLNTREVNPDRKSKEVDDAPQTPLLIATAKGHKTITKLLLDTGEVDPNSKDGSRRRWTPLLHAVNRGNKGSVKLLLERGASPDYIDKNGRTPLSLAAENGNEAIVRQLLAKTTLPINQTEIINKEWAYVTPSLFKWYCEAMLLDLQKIDKISKIGTGFSALHYAAMNGNVKIIRLLLKNGANIEEKSVWGTNALSMAIVKTQGEVARALIERGANVEAELGPNWTILHIAAARRDADMLQVLLENGASTKRKDKEGRTALHMVVLGVPRCANFDTEQLRFRPPTLGDGRTAVRLLLKHGVNTEAKDKSGATALYMAAHLGDADMVRILASHGASVNARLNGEWMPLHAAAGRGYTGVVQALVENQAEIDAITAQGYTALLIAAATGHIDIVKFLVESGANLEIRDNRGKTALDAAVEQGKQEVVDFLREKCTGHNTDKE